MRFPKFFAGKTSKEDRAIKALVGEFENALRETLQSESKTDIPTGHGYQMDMMRSVYPSVLTRLHPTWKAFAAGEDYFTREGIVSRPRSLPPIDQTVCFPDRSDTGLGMTEDSILLWFTLKWEELHPGATKEAADNRRDVKHIDTSTG